MEIETRTTIKCFNPATGEVLGAVPCASKTEVDETVRKAWIAFESWRLTNYDFRAAKLMNLKRVISLQMDELATMISAEIGKPLLESYLAELTGPLDACTWLAKNTEKLLKEQIIHFSNPLLLSKQSIVTLEPCGVVAIISPWNYPFAIPMMAIIMAVITGNAVVLKPSEKSSLIGVKIEELFQLAGFPQDLVTVITGDKQTGSSLVASPVQKILFTGSVVSGSKVMAAASTNVIPVSLELGGKDAAIVLPDAPVDWTAKGIVWGAFTNCGQACASIERLYIVKGENTEQLISSIVAKTKQLQVGSGLDHTTEVGPLIDENQLQMVEEHVNDAKSLGAQVLCGGQRYLHPNYPHGHFYQPTVLINVNHSMRVMKEETFGPVLSIMLVDNEDEAVKLANDSDFGLSASVWTKDLACAEAIACDLDVGTVFINDCLFSFACPQLPWGGMKKSGFGKTHSYFGLLDLVNIKHIAIDAANNGHRMWWYPYGLSRLKQSRGGVEFLYSSLPMKKLHGLVQFIWNSVFKDK